MNVLIVDETRSGLDFALRCRDAGHTVKWFISVDRGLRSEVGEGFDGIERVEDWEAVVKSNWPDLIFLTDNCKYLHQLERYRGNIPIVAPTPESVLLELDRQIGMDFLNDCGVDTPDSYTFSNYDVAEDFIRAQYKKDPEKRFVSKPSGDADKALSYVGKSAKGMITMLRRWKKFPKKNAKPFILQEFIEGIEMAVGAWFGPHGFSRFVCENFEFKKLMPGDQGVSTGEMGTVVRYVKRYHSKLFREVLAPCERALKKLGYVGYVDLNCIIDLKHPAMPLEWTMRPGWPLFQIQQELHLGDPAQWLVDLYDGKDTLQVSNAIAAGIVVAMPDFPYSRITNKEISDFPIWGVKSFKHVHPAEVKMGVGVCDGLIEAPCLVTAGDYVCIASGQGTTVKEAVQNAYKVAKSIEIANNPFSRNDIGLRLKRQLPKLLDHGYATGIRYE